MEMYGVMNILDSIELNWFNTSKCEAIYSFRNEPIFWLVSFISRWRFLWQSTFFRKDQSFLYSQLSLPLSKW